MKHWNADDRIVNLNRALAILFVLGLLVAVVKCLTSCAAPLPKPCSVALEAQYAAELVETCLDAGSVEACGDAGAGVTARHEAAQKDAGCRE